MNIKKVTVIGLGYVGLPLCFNISKFFNTIGYDLDKKKINQLNLGNDITKNFTSKDLKKKKLNLHQIQKKLKIQIYLSFAFQHQLGKIISQILII